VAKKFHGALREVLKPCMGIAVYGTEVANGKPAPDIFLEGRFFRVEGLGLGGGGSSVPRRPKP